MDRDALRVSNLTRGAAAIASGVGRRYFLENCSLAVVGLIPGVARGERAESPALPGASP
jgi:hypothetical protein